MKRWTWIILATVLAGSALAQAPFTIVRPVEGAKVRETVRVQIPKNSIPDNSYVGVFLNGKFIEGTILEAKGDFYEYLLDTKARKIPDGKTKLELVLYRDAANSSRITDRTSIEIEVVNVASIPIPEEGLDLHYKFQAGKQYTYTVEDRTAIVTISEAQAKLGGRAAELPIEASHVRMLYAIDNAYGNGDGLVRMQALPEKNKRYAFLKTQSDPEGKRFEDYEMHPLYMRLDRKGVEKFGSVPVYAGVEGGLRESMRTDLFATFPLPTLPNKRVKPGSDATWSTWSSWFQAGNLDLEKLAETTSLVQKIPCRGELLGVEWEAGHPCAKYRNSLRLNAGARQNTGGSDGGVGLGNTGVQMEETIWFALDLGIPVKITRDQQQDIRMQAPSGGGGGGAAPGTGGGRGPGLGTSGGGGRGPGAPGSGGAAPADDRIILPNGNYGYVLFGNFFRQGSATGNEGGPPGTGGQGRGGNAAPGAGNSGSGGGGGIQYMRIRQQQILTLEK
ncbi:MAG: hypothetical protein KF784_03670 [Fimbriimonadaceae bacterium]|nr:hypothetical protein [Fimbriimonadaceae bacterium]